jgi:hypothetical protein
MLNVLRIRVLATLGATILLLGASSGTAAAGPIYSCPAGSPECAGQTFALWIANSGTGFFDITFSIDTTGYTGSETDLARGVEFKSVLTSNNEFDSISLLSGPGGAGSWIVNPKQLAQGCTGGTKQDTGCAIWNGIGGYNFTIGSILSWTFHVVTTSPIDFAGGHIKYEYVDATGQKKVAGLLSGDITLQDCRNGACDERAPVPEPGSLALLGVAMLGGAHRLRRRFKA